VSRQYQLLPGAPYGPVTTPFGVMVTYPGYLAAVFIHDNRIVSALIARASADRQLAALRVPAAFDAATRAIPALAAWTEPRQARPITPVLPGGRLYNSYRGQLNSAGQVALDGNWLPSSPQQAAHERRDHNGRRSPTAHQPVRDANLASERNSSFPQPPRRPSPGGSADLAG
jgi:hypothetical protein